MVAISGRSSAHLEGQENVMAVLVIGATGNIGPHVVRGLMDRGKTVRVFTRDAARAQAVLPEGVDIIAGDITDSDHIASAATETESVFLLTPHAADMADVQLRIIRALRRTPTRIVKLSGTASAITPDGPLTCRQHWEIEQVLAAAGQPHTILRPNAFMQVLIDQIMIPALRTQGVIPNALADSGISLIDVRDIADVAVSALTDDFWAGSTLTLTGPRSVSYRDIAQLIGAQTGVTVGLADITPDMVRAGLLDRGMQPWEAEHFGEMYQLFRDGRSEFVTDDVRRVTGHEPRTIESYLAERKTMLTETINSTGAVHR
jgi:uncharacterized protein YbjT (DUF2867 family)